MPALFKHIEHYDDLMSAFYGVNWDLFSSDETRGIAHSYNLDFFVKPIIKRPINFTKMVNYTAAKWGGLVSNYLDFSEFQYIKERVSKRLGSKSWAETMKFSHNTKSREACLISATFLNDEANNILFIHVRTSEVYKRLAMDLVLAKRLGDAIFGDHPYIIRVFINHAWLSADWGSMLLKKPKFRRLGKSSKSDTIAGRCYIKYKHFKKADWRSFTYNAHKRPARVLQNEVHSKHITSDDCFIS